ncbi:MAG: non-canonical purine NTP pyrophosphatase [Gemmatimonadota bacterium]|nr:non-canonical purine NTP pyrophosphatase [Gemmatimonadota bacterium]
MRNAWVLASRNQGKLVELRALFASEGIDVVDLRDVGVGEDSPAEDEIESYATFEENALAKARYFSARLPNRIVVADDSGLTVGALHGGPGVRSKRWSGKSDIHGPALDADNNALLAASMANHHDRSAEFVCAAAWTDSSVEAVTRGVVAGRILDRPAGSRGFGYDPYFFVHELGMTMAEASLTEKQRVSHRARAFLSLIRDLRARGFIE